MIVANYVHVDDVEQDAPTPETLLAATLALGAAVDQLTQPGLERLDRSPANDEAVQLVDAEHAAHARELQAAHALALHRRDEMGVLRARARIIAHDLRARKRAVTQAALPSLLEQLAAAVAGTGGRNGVHGAGPYRAAIGLAAAELLGHIERAVWCHRSDVLAVKLREWADAVTAEQNATALPACAAAAEQWVVRARQILAPDRGFEIPEPCPVCGNRWAHVLDDTGTRVRKSALYVGYADQVARCLVGACGYRWPKPYWDHLKALLEQRRNERDAG